MKIAVVIPCYRVKSQISGVLAAIDAKVARIFVVDDACPEGTGAFVKQNSRDSRVEVITLPQNQGVGGATMAGFHAAQKAGYEIVVKIDGDGQMDPRLLPRFTDPIEKGEADYTKGNRFYSPRSLTGMPFFRLWGNAALSLLCKITSGYWQVMDPTNGYLALHTSLLPWLETDKLERRYFFEIDLLYRLGILRALVVDIPMNSVYRDEVSNLSIKNTLISFPPKLFARAMKRLTYCYFIRDFNIASLFFLASIPLLTFGVVFGALNWNHSIVTRELTSSGTVMLSALPVLMGLQLLLFALQYDVLMQPKHALYPTLGDSLSKN